MKFSWEIWHSGLCMYFHGGKFEGRLFQAWLDFFTFLKLGAAEVCALGVLLVGLKFTFPSE